MQGECLLETVRHVMVDGGTDRLLNRRKALILITYCLEKMGACSDENGVGFFTMSESTLWQFIEWWVCSALIASSAVGIEVCWHISDLSWFLVDA